MAPSETGIPDSVPRLDKLAGTWQPVGDFVCMPSVNNLRGAVKIDRDLVSVSHLAFPPLTLGGEQVDESWWEYPEMERPGDPVPTSLRDHVRMSGIAARWATAGSTARVRFNGKRHRAEEYRWYPHQVRRRATVDGLHVESTVRMPDQRPSVLLELTIANPGPRDGQLRVEVELLGPVRRYDSEWSFWIPRPALGDEWDCAFDGATVIVSDRMSPASMAFAFADRPGSVELLATGAVATWDLELAAGAECRIGIVIVTSGDEAPVGATAAAMATDFTASFAEAGAAWQRRFDDAFTPENGRYSGHLPVLATDDALVRRVYYVAVASMLALERTTLNPRYRRVFVTAGPRNAITTSYFWDCPTLLWALLDPAEMRKQLELFLTIDPHSCYAVDFIEERGVGPWYAANDSAMFEMFAAYLGVTHDWVFLDLQVGGKTVLRWLEAFATAWQALTDGGELADYGGVDNLLECVPTYVGMVPSFNSANVAMMRSLAHLVELRADDAELVVRLREQADRLARSILEQLYVPGTGHWRCLQADGSANEVRHAIDFFSVGRYLSADLAPNIAEEMVAFALEELVDGSWMHALSPLDAAAAFSDRSDHGPRGAFDRWPALTVTALANLGRPEEALSLLRAAEAVTAEGPFGQAHRYRADGPPQLAPEHEHNEVAGSAFADTIVRTLFGYDPDAGGRSPIGEAAVGDFTGSLRGLRWGDELIDLEVEPTGVRIMRRA
jgi:hypothetical protein